MFKKMLSIILVVLILCSVCACGDDKVINNVEYKTVGLLSEYVDEGKQPGIKYDIIWGNVIWGVILVETIVAPIYFFGFSIAEPVGVLPKKS